MSTRAGALYELICSPPCGLEQGLEKVALLFTFFTFSDKILLPLHAWSLFTLLSQQMSGNLNSATQEKVVRKYFITDSETAPIVCLVERKWCRKLCFGLGMDDYFQKSAENILKSLQGCQVKCS